MVKEINLPFTSETCDKIHEILTHALLLSGPPSLIIGVLIWFPSQSLLNASIGIGLTVYGLIFSLAALTIYGEAISDWYEDHHIVFKCKCEQQNPNEVKHE